MKLKSCYIISVNKCVHLHGDCTTLQYNSNAIFGFQIGSFFEFAMNDKVLEICSQPLSGPKFVKQLDPTVQGYNLHFLDKHHFQSQARVAEPLLQERISVSQAAPP